MYYVLYIIYYKKNKTISGFDLVRLTNPKADGSYMVEVRYDQKWRTLCGQNWHPANARVVCKQVGQPS